MKPFHKIVPLLLLLGPAMLTAAEPGQPAADMKQPGTPPKVLKQQDPVYPYSMARAGLNGRVRVDFVVDTKGDVQNPVVVSSNNPWFERPALEAILQWKFTPASKDGHTVKVRARQDISFHMDRAGSKSTGLWNVPKRKKDDGLPPELQWDVAPVPVNTAFPVYPLAALQAEKSGKTKLKFLVGPDGRVASAQLVEATTPEMGQAVLAMIDTWVFTPPTKKDGTPCFAALAMEHDFKPRSISDVPVATEALTILRLQEKHPEKIAALTELDVMPKPLSRRPPVYPSALRQAGQAGRAEIEFFIDENGDAQLPYVLSSSAPEFGYAAVQAVATWRFEPARKGGKKVVARATVPVEFIADKP